ncbi:hypothetical protein ACHAQA_002585 [Verticillium albo-atrum]
MKKFGFGSKKGGDDGGDDDASRNALFGRKKSSQPPAGENPYARAPPANDPYAQSSKSAAPAPYQQQRPGFQSGGPGGLPGGPGPRRTPSAGGASTHSQPPPPYGDASERSSSGYGADRYGASGGYGDNRYDSGGGSGGGYGGANRYGASSASAARGPGGYGGLGRTNSTDTDAQRDQLFSGAQERNQQRQPAPGSNDGYGQGSSGGDPYGGYGAERQLTEEELEAQEVKDVKKQIQDTRQESINSLNRSIALAHQAADTGINTMNILARDEERLINTEKRLDEAANYNKIGADRAKKLKSLNRSMFAVHVNNPFTNTKRTAEQEQRVLDNHRAERDLRNETRKNGWDSSQQMEKTMRGLNIGPDGQRASGKSSAAEKSKYVFLDEDDDENNQALEDEATIDRQMDELGGAVSILNRVAKAQTETVQRQIVSADRINEKTDMVDDGVRLNRARLDRIK